MKWPLVPLLLISCVLPAWAFTDPVAFHPGTGVPNPLHGGGREVTWSEPPDLNGLIGSSEVMNSVGLNTEIANDFIPRDGPIIDYTWWGGFFDVTLPCQSGITTPGFNLGFFEEAGCVPGTLIYAISLLDPVEESIGCQAGTYPLFKWTSCIPVYLIPGNRYWFDAQMMDHPYPPQFGRLAAAHVTDCDSVFKGAIFSFPDWTPAIDVFGVPYDASQEFNEGMAHWVACCWPDGHCDLQDVVSCVDFGGIDVGCSCSPNPCPQPTGACCRTDGRCLYTNVRSCSAIGGQYLGDGTVCDPNPCQATPTRGTTWGNVKLLYR